MNTESKIKLTASCLLGISDDWGYSDIEQFLDWQLDNLDDLADGYPRDVMTREYEDDIMNEVDNQLNNKIFRKINHNLGLAMHK